MSFGVEEVSRGLTPAAHSGHGNQDRHCILIRQSKTESGGRRLSCFGGFPGFVHHLRWRLRFSLFLRQPVSSHFVRLLFALSRCEFAALFLGRCFHRCGCSIAGHPFGRRGVFAWATTTLHSSQNRKSLLESANFSLQCGGDCVCVHRQNYTLIVRFRIADNTSRFVRSETNERRPGLRG
jgi:hypothetical protein